ncbi:MAG: 4Fe-4S binding protein, partial [Planctomycetaceae bacterium]|nr:4Fe-4S binding protein [Planctomycetaceae bacterium]
TAVQIGHAVWSKANCVVIRDKVTCKNCERHCPTGAIQLIPQDAANPDSLKIPAIDVERCIGCGACEHLCPSRPLSAIHIEGHERHRII